MTFHFLFSCINTLLLAVGFILAARFFSRRENQWIEREEKWRERERVLVDRLLGQAHVRPVEIQREKVVKLPDPEVTPPPSWIDEAFAVDEVKEELEQFYPEAARMTHAQARSAYPAEWARIQKRLKEEATPLRAG